jgi:hypothetical protein
MLAFSLSGFATQKFAGRPARSMFARNAATPNRPLLTLLPAAPALLLLANGFGLNIASGLYQREFLKFEDVYRLASPARLVGIPLKCAR